MEHYFARKERLIAPIYPSVAGSRNVGISEHGNYLRLAERIAGIERSYQSMGVRGAHRPGVQQTREPSAQIVRV
jgi:hypothetical protein